MVAHCAPGVWHDSECHHCGRYLLEGVFPTAARPHNCHLRLSGHSSAGRHSQVYVQDCRHPPITGEGVNKAVNKPVKLKTTTGVGYVTQGGVRITLVAMGLPIHPCGGRLVV